MPPRLGVEIVGDASSLKAALGSAAAATDRFAADYKLAFAGMSDATLRLAVAQDKLAISTARYGAGTTGAAAATLKYRREIEALSAAQLRAVETVGSTITRGITVPTALLGLAAVKMGVDFNKQMLLIQTQAGASASEVKNLSDQVLGLAKGDAAQSPVELAKGLYHLESLGLRGAAAMKTLRVAALAAGMGVADLEQVTTALGGAVVTGIRGTGDYEKAMATLNATIGAGNMRMDDLVAALGTGVLPAAKNAGLSLDQVGAALAVLTDRGVDAQNAGTRLRMTFALIQAPSEKARKALKDMGVDADQMAKTLRGPNGLLNVLQMLHEGMQRVGQVKGSKDILQAFGGGRSGSGILTLLQSLDASLSSYQKKLEDVRAGQRKYAEDQKAYMESPAYKLDQALTSLEADLTKLGQSLTPAVTGMAEVLSTIADGFSALPGPVKQDLGIVIGLLAVGGPLMLAGAGVVKMVKTIGTAFSVLPATAGPAIATTEAEIAGLEATTAAAALQAGTLLSRLRLLAGIGTITIGIQELVSQIGSGAGRSSAYNFAHDINPKTGKQGFLGQAVGAVGRATGLYDFGGGGAKTAPKGPGGVDLMPGVNPTDVTSIEKGIADFLKEPIARPVGSIDRSAAVPPLTPPKPSTTLPRRLLEASYLAELTSSLADDLKVAKAEEAYFRAQLDMAKKGTKTYDTILQNLAQAHQSVESIQSQIASEQERHTKAVASAAKKRKQAAQASLKELQDEAKSVRDEIQTARDTERGLFGALFSGPILQPTDAQRKAMLGVPSASPTTLLRDLEAQLKLFKRFQSELATLKHRGAPASLVSQLRDTGPSVEPEVAALAKAPRKLLDKYFSVYGQAQHAITAAAAMDVAAKQVTLRANTVTLAGVKSSALATIEIHNLNLPGVHNAKQLLEELNRLSRRGTTQRRGRNPGRGTTIGHA